jgi:hypothetical protein
MKPTVYIETPIVSYLVANPSNDLRVAAQQSIAREWWENEARGFDLFISGFVVEEASRGDPIAAGRQSCHVRRYSGARSK